MRLRIRKSNRLAILSLSSEKIILPVAKGLLQNGIGLLAYASLDPDDGLVVQSRNISTVGMRFSIAIFPFDACGTPLAKPIIAPPGKFFRCPEQTRFVAEVHPSLASLAPSVAYPATTMERFSGCTPTLLVAIPTFFLMALLFILASLFLCCTFFPAAIFR